MKKILMGIFLVISLAGCATATKMHGSDGKEMYHVACDGIALPWSACYKKALETCPGGYFLRSGQESSGSVASGSSGSNFYGAGSFSGTPNYFSGSSSARGSSYGHFVSANGIFKGIKIQCKEDITRERPEYFKQNIQAKKVSIKEGIYRVFFEGRTSFGFAVFEFRNNVVVGQDEGNVRYFGTYSYNQTTDQIEADLEVTVPPGMPLVMGVPAQKKLWKFKFKLSFPAGTPNTPFLVKTPYGNVKAIIKFYR